MIRRHLSLAVSLSILAASWGPLPARVFAQVIVEPVRIGPAVAVAAPVIALTPLSSPVLSGLSMPKELSLGTLSSLAPLAVGAVSTAGQASAAARSAAVPSARASAAASTSRAAARSPWTRVLSAAPAASVLRDLPKVEGLAASDAHGAGERLMDAVVGGRTIASEADLPEAAVRPLGALQGRAPAAAASPAKAGRPVRTILARGLDSLRVSKGGLRVAASLSLGALMSALIAGVASGPHTPAFAIFRGAFIFWSVLGSITLHEAAHAWTAEKMGDVSARMAGQISANPWRYTSPGSATMLFVTAMLGFPFGFFFTVMQAKIAHPVNKGKMAKVALAGPAMNLALTAAMVAAVLAVKTMAPGLAAVPWVGGTLRLLVFSAWINFLLGASNLIPLGPLDGQKVLRAAAPNKAVGKSGRWNWVKVFDAVTVPLGLLALLGFMVSGLIANLLGAVKHGGAGTPLAHTHDPFMMTLVAMGFLVWAVAMIPWVKAKLADMKAAAERARVLAAGGYAVGLQSTILKGKVPRPAVLSEPVAIAWKGRALPRSAPISPEVVFEFAPEAGMDAAIDLSNGETVRIDDAARQRIASDESAVVVRRGTQGDIYGLLPASAVGGPRALRLRLETAAAADAVGTSDDGRSLLTPVQVGVVKSLSAYLKAPVYELEAEATAAHRRIAIYAQAENGRVFFVRLAVLKAIEASSGAERQQRIEQLQRYLSALRDGAEGLYAGASLILAHEAYMAGEKDFAAWTSGL